MATSLDENFFNANHIFAREAAEIYSVPLADAAKRVSDLVRVHRERVDGEVFLFSSPGRIEIAGNHTDHNNGKVLAAAVSVDLLAAVTPASGAKVVIASAGYPVVEVDLSDLSIHEDEKGGSSALVRGVAKALTDRGYAVGGFYATTVSDVFKGAGMSSSASFEVLVAEIFNEFYNGGKISPVEKAIISQYAENVYFGKPSGLMDQSAIAIGGASYIDFKNPASPIVEKLDWSFSDTSAVVVNCGGDHSDLTPQYAAIREEMEAVAGYFGKEKLRFVGEEEFLKALPALNKVFSGRALLRALHYFGENDRVDALRAAVIGKDADKAYSLISGSGKSSCEKLQNCRVDGDLAETIPLALALTSEFEGVRACRVHGGGFAGTILAFVDNAALQGYVNYISEFFGKNNVYTLKIRAAGAKRILFGGLK